MYVCMYVCMHIYIYIYTLYSNLPKAGPGRCGRKAVEKADLLADKWGQH